MAAQVIKPPRLEAEYVADELVVTMRPEPLRAPAVGSLALASAGTAQLVGDRIRSALARHTRPGRAALLDVSPSILAARIRVGNPSLREVVASELRANPSVAAVERNAIIWREHTARGVGSTTALGTLPNDPFYPFQAWHYAMVQAPEAWTLTTGSASVLVAVVDDGIRFDHGGIAANLTSDGYDFVSSQAVPVCSGGTIDNAGDGDGYDPDPTQPASYRYAGGCITGTSSPGNHGLHVAGTIGAVGNDGAGGTGLNWAVRIRPVRVLGIAWGTNYDIAQGILYAAGLPASDGMGGTVQAASGARIINLSLGGPSPSADLENAVVAATNAGSLLIAAAGNDAVSDPFYPAAYPQVLSVAALGPDGVLASYSNYGSTIDISAPGGDRSDGDNTFSVWSTTWDYVGSSAVYSGWDGTSMAAPHVSGVAALLLAREAGLTGAQLRDRLLNYVVDRGAAGRDDVFGHGLVNARNSLTETLAPTAQLIVRLLNASTGAVLQTANAGSDGSFSFTELSDGDYAVYAGQDGDGDQITAVPLRRWGAHGGSSTPTAVTVSGAGTHTASFTIGLPGEMEENNTFATADALPLGGYMIGTIESNDVDVYRVRISATGQYTFETAPVEGACNFALEEDTYIELYDGLGTLLAAHDDINEAAYNYCARITTTLATGTYYLAVKGRYEVGWRYALLARTP